MKRYINFISTILLMAFVWTGCDTEDPELGPAPTSEQVQFTMQPDADNPNLMHFISSSPGFKAIWDFGNGSSATGKEVTGAFPLKGEYTVTLTIFTEGGYAANSKTVTIQNTNPLMLDVPEYNLLTGGAEELAGKTWVVDKENSGHLALGPVGAYTQEWYSAPANSKSAEGLYDDEMTFNLDGFAYTYKNNGNTFVNTNNLAAFGGAGPDDATMPYTPKTGLTWSIVEEEGKKYLIISNGGFMGYYTGVSRYEILKLSENELYVRHLNANVAEQAWYQRFVPKGYSKPKPPKPYQVADLKEDFDEAGTIVWQTDQVKFNENYDNPAPLAPNKSAKVGQYIKQEGQAHEFDNLYTTLAYKMDLTSKNKIKLKVYMPSYNDYVTENGEGWAIKNLLKQVSVKLQNSEAAEPWANQEEVKQEVTKLNEWVVLTFDFSEAAARKDLDRVVIQIGGEGNFIPGIFYIDDIELTQ
ncbi:PKD domain-containing protein [Pontibacter rugosus]|uniref:PKD domain-containing protein n=1 Tax=Pontibacter rugosus TaxID=1745966 RepID=A0ABW3SQA7_9BACT